MPGPEDPDINIDDGNNNGNNSNDNSSDKSSGGSSSSSSSGGDSWFSDRKNSAMYSQFQAVYQQLWGETATEAYIKSAINKGLNVWEFADRERHKPAWFRRSEAARDKSSSLAKTLHDLGIV